MSEDQRKDLPPVTSPNFLEKVREVITTYLGNRGDKLDRGITLRDLADADIVNVRSGFLSGSSSKRPISGPGSAITPATATEPDLTPPPTPSGFVATAAITNVLLETSAPNFTQGHGYFKTKIYGFDYTAGGTLPTFSQAQVITEYTGDVFSYSTYPATTWRLWAAWVTVDGVESSLPAGGANGISVTTGQDVTKLITALSGKITASELVAGLNARINVIDGGALGTTLPRSLTEMAVQQTATEQRVYDNLDILNTNLLKSLVTIDGTNTRMANAGIYVDPGTGTVKISGLEATNSQLTTVDARLSAAEGSISLKASTTYVDNAVAGAVIDPTQLPVFTTLEARVQTAEIDIDSVEASVALKASTLALDSTNVRMTTAEVDINALEGTVTTKVDNATFTSVTGGLDVRLGTAESTLTSFGDTSQITNLVTRSYEQVRDANASAEDLLRAVLNTQNETTYRTADVALARTDLTAYVDAGVSAEASQRLMLVAQVDANAAAITAEQITRANADSAEAIARQTLDARVGTAEAAVVSEQVARASADGVLTSSVNALSASIGDSAAQITEINTSKIGYCVISGLASDYVNRTTCEAAGGTWAVGIPLAAAVKQVSVSDGAGNATLESRFTAQKTLDDQFKVQYSIKLDVNGYVSGYGIYSTGTNSEFIVNTDKFAVTVPNSALTTRTNSTAYALGKCVTAATGTMAVCTQAGTSAGSAPDFAQAVGTVITDGTVEWQIASRVQLAVLSSSTTINDAVMNPGVYIDGASIARATINSAQIGELSADRIKTGTLSVGLGGSAGWLTSQVVTTTNGTGKVVAKISTDFASTWNTTSGYYLGNQGGTQKFYIGNGSTKSVQWDGTDLTVRGTVFATAGELQGLTIKNAAGVTLLSSVTVPSDVLNSSVTLGGLGFTGATNANYTTNTNQLTDGANLGGTAAWTGISGGGKPADNATVGATIGVNLGGQITSGNASTYIAAAAIDEAYIGNLSASKITAGFIDAARIEVGTATASTTGYVNNEVFYPTIGTSSHECVCSASATLTTSGGGIPLLVMARIDFAVNWSAIGTHASVIAGVYMDGSVVSANENSSQVYTVATSGGGQSLGTIQVMYRTTSVSAGSHTFRIRLSAVPRNGIGNITYQSGSYIAVSANLAILENKI